MALGLFEANGSFWKECLQATNGVALPEAHGIEGIHATALGVSFLCHSDSCVCVALTAELENCFLNSRLIGNLILRHHFQTKYR